MLTGFILIVYILLLSWLSGISANLLLSRILKTETTSFHPGIIILLGLLAMASSLQIVHLFGSISYGSHLLIWSINGFVFLFYRPLYRKQIADQLNVIRHNHLAFWFPALLVAALINLIGRAGVGDIGDYHLQAIQWDEKFKVVPGLGNLRRQLGNNSNWFLLHAFAGCWFLNLKSVYVLNAVLLIVSCLYFLPAEGKKNNLMKSVILIYIVLMSFRKYVGAVTNDYAITIFTLMIFTEWVERDRTDLVAKLMLVLMLLMLPTLKLSAITLLIIVPGFMVFLFQSKAEWKYSLVIIVSGIIVFVPWFITNYLQSGYLIYPLEQTGWLAPDWQMRPATLVYERVINMANERLAGMPIDEVMKLSFMQWFPHWIKNLDVFSKLLIGLFLFLPIVNLFRVIRDKNLFAEVKRRLHEQQVFILLLTIAVAMPVWFFNAPATRFVFGYLVFFIAWNVHLLFADGSIKIKRVWLISAASIILLGNGLLFIHEKLNATKFQESLLRPLPYGSNQLRYVPLPLGYVRSPLAGEQCWDADLPCSSIIDSTLHWRTTDLDDGFALNQ